MKRGLKATLLVGIVLLAGCTQKQKAEQTIDLFNGTDFSGWTLFIPGDSVDVNDVWSINEGVVHCTGVPNGFMMTEESFSNYKLHLEWRWVEEPTNSGVLLHCQNNDQVWPNCLECQLKSGSAGDFVLIGPGQITVDDSVYVNQGRFLVVPKKQESSEKPAGEWNAYDIEVRGASVTATVNGVLQNSGTDCAFSSGPIALQSEGSPIEFRNIQLTPLQD